MNKTEIRIEIAEQEAVKLVEIAEQEAVILVEIAEQEAVKLVEIAILNKEKSHLIKVASTNASCLVKTATTKAALLMKDATNKASLLVKEASEKAYLVQEEDEKRHLATKSADELVGKKMEFLDIAAHELRNPITSLSLLLLIIEKQVEKGQPISLEILARLRAPTDRLVRLVTDLMEMSKLERGMLSLLLVSTDIVVLISDCIEEFRAIAQNRQIVFNMPTEPIWITIDALRINQVLTNFLDNAIKYTLDGAIEINLEIKPSAIRVSVIDNGAGIPKEDLDTLFIPFARGHSAINIRTKGLGLGLSVCKGIIDLHNGTIGVSSVEGQGSTFFFEIPNDEINK